MRPKITIALFIAFVCICYLPGQSGSEEPVGYPGGITLEFGLGSYALIDHYISPEPYDGTLPYYAIGWSRSHEKYVYTLSGAFRQSNNVSNYSVTTEVLNYRLSQGFLYPIKTLKFLKKDLGLWIGPTTDILYYLNNPNIAVSGFDYTNSYAILWSLGFRSDAIYPLSGRISLESSLQFSVLSVGQRTVDHEEDDQPEAKALSLVSGLNGSYDLGARFDLINWMSIGFFYRFELIRITAWEDVVSASNSAVLCLYLRF